MQPRRGVPGQEKGRAGRLRARGIECTLGPVLDLSATGLRALCPGDPPAAGARLSLTIRSVAGIFDIPAEVIRVQESGPHACELGLRFVDVGVTEREMLLATIRTCFARATA